MKSRILTLAFTLITAISFAQVGIGTTSPDASAVLDMTSTTQGVLIPRMTTTQREAITSPAIGLQVYDTDTKAIWFYNGAAWMQGAGGAGKFIDGATNDIAYYDGRVGIGRDNFSTVHKLYIEGIKDTDGANTAVLIDAIYNGTGTSTSTIGVSAASKNQSTGVIDRAIASQSIVDNGTDGTITNGYASELTVTNNGTMTDGVAVVSSVNNSGTITRGYSQSATVYNAAGSQINNSRLNNLTFLNYGTMTDAYGIYLDYFSSGSSSVTNSYALYINSRFNKGNTKNYSIYSDSDADSYFNGNIGVGEPNPQQKLHVSGVMRLEPQATPPTGALGDLYVNSNGKLFFHNGTEWKEVSLN